MMKPNKAIALGIECEEIHLTCDKWGWFLYVHNSLRPGGIQRLTQGDVYSMLAWRAAFARLKGVKYPEWPIDPPLTRGA